MNLSKGEFSRFNLKSKTMLLNENGLILLRKKTNEDHEIRLYLIFDFYVEVFFDMQKNKIQSAEPLLNNSLLELYFK